MTCKAITHTLRAHTALILLLAGATVFSFTAGARERHDSIEVKFRQSKSVIDLTVGGNGSRLDSVLSGLPRAGSPFRVKGIRVVGAASPEGSTAINRRLSEQRAGAIFDYVATRVDLPDSIATFTFTGRDWEGLRRLCQADTALPCRDEVLALLDNEILPPIAAGLPDGTSGLRRLKSIGGGKAYAYMYARMFPALRASVLYIDYIPVHTFAPVKPSGIPVLGGWKAGTVAGGIIVAPPVAPAKPFYMALKTNMLYDLAALPTVGAEIYAGRNISVAADWTYGWWKTDRRHRYWRAYGGDVTVRRWFGSKAAAKPLTGHHAGIFAGAFTYDFEWGGKGYMGGKPGGTLWDRCMWMAGVEYGYSLPVGRRINIDFSLGIGYIRGTYMEYVPDGEYYMWQSTHRMSRFGLAKAEISLVWLIGRGNINQGKGGRR